MQLNERTKLDELVLLKSKANKYIEAYYEKHPLNGKATTIANNICEDNNIDTNVEDFLAYHGWDVITQQLSSLECKYYLNYYKALAAGYLLLSRESDKKEYPHVLTVLDPALANSRLESNNNLYDASIYFADNLLMPRDEFVMLFNKFKNNENQFNIMQRLLEVEKTQVAHRAKRLSLESGNYKSIGL